jgi:hypothetical protein
VIVDFPIPGGANLLAPVLYGVKRRIEGDTRRFAVMAKRDVRAAFDALGLGEVREVGQFVLPMVLHRKLGAPGVSGALEGAMRRARLDTLIGTPVVMCAARADADAAPEGG